MIYGRICIKAHAKIIIKNELLKMNNNNSFAAIDFELANGVRNSVCSVGIVVVENGEIVDQYYSLVKPPKNKYHWGKQIN